METNVRKKTALIGEIVVAAFDEAASYTNDPTEVSRLAADLVTGVLRLNGRSRGARPRPSRRRGHVRAARTRSAHAS